MTPHTTRHRSVCLSVCQKVIRVSLCRNVQVRTLFTIILLRRRASYPPTRADGNHGENQQPTNKSNKPDKYIPTTQQFITVYQSSREVYLSTTNYLLEETCVVWCRSVVHISSPTGKRRASEWRTNRQWIEWTVCTDRRL